MSIKRFSLNNGELKVGETPEEDALVGSKCSECGKVFFPKRKYCALCCKPSTRELLLSVKGQLLSYSLVNRKPKFALIESPYFIGEVTLPEEVVVCTVLDAGPKDIKEGAVCVLGTKKVKEDKEGNDILAYVFRPQVR